MILDLADPAAVDRGRAGPKAATLAQAFQSGLPVLPGFIVEASASSGHLQIGAAALPLRGSGGARLAVTAEPLPDGYALVSAGRDLAKSLVARSSSIVERGGEWAGAFSSYVGISPEELPKAVVGCWASSFSVDALARQDALGLEPGSIGMAVLVQPAIKAACGGVAELESDGEVGVHAVAGTPTSLLQGWESGVTARMADGRWAGEEAIALVGEESLDQLKSVLEAAAARLEMNRCEWAVGDQLWLLQLDKVARPAPDVAPRQAATPADLRSVVRAMAAAPGVLTAETTALLGRLGVRSWEPWVAAVVFAQGTVSHGTPAATGVGAGVRHHVDPATGAAPPRRTVITADLPLPQLSQHIWDAAGLVTATGSPAAHVFEAARSLRVPAVCGVEIPHEGDLIVAVDGRVGEVATLPIEALQSSS